MRRRSGENERTESGCRLVDDVGHRLQTFDAVVAGDLYAARPVLFEVLLQLSTDSIYVTTSDAMHELAMRGTLACVEVGELGCHWFGAKTITAVYRGVAAQVSKLDEQAGSRGLTLLITGTVLAGGGCAKSSRPKSRPRFLDGGAAAALLAARGGGGAGA